MRTLVVVVMVGILGVSSGFAARKVPKDEPPRATDLLRAQRFAEEVEERRKLPPPIQGSGWRKGGTGWDTPGSSRGGRKVQGRVGPGTRR
jgi:hypothetical protein